MSDRIITLRKFANPVDAHAARVALEAAGIRATVSDEETTGSLWYLSPSLGGVKLYVNENDAERAGAILEEAKDLSSARSAPAPWKCPTCGETVPAEFDECWSCGQTYDPSHAQQDDSAADEVELPRETGPEYSAGWNCPSCGAVVPFKEKRCGECGAEPDVSNPYISSATPATPATRSALPAATDEMNAVAHRAFIAAVFGMTCPIVANFYSLSLVFEVIGFRHQLSPRAKLCLYGAIAIDALVLGFLGLMVVLRWMA